VHIDGVADREIIVDYLATGEFFGELPMFLDSRQRSAAIKAKFACEVAELSYTRFRALSQQHPDLIFAVAKQMANRPCSYHPKSQRSCVSRCYLVA
jgi:CRP/FNR family cyclic AMP-dependent transcriptional regulator